MWSFFSRDPTKDFAYEVGEKVPGLDNKSIWALHEGKHKTTAEGVSIFVFDLKATSEAQAQLARASLKKIKTLRHPNILTYIDGLESDKVIYVATEKVVPLETYLRESKNQVQNDLAISWGLHQITKGLSFLINDCGFIHNNVCLWSVFVDKAGEWKLGGVDYMYTATGPDSTPPVKILPALEKYDPPEKKGSGGRRPTEKWSADMWGLGCLIWEVYNGSLPETSSLKALGKIPKPLVPNYCELVGANPKSRPNPARFIESGRSRGGFMDNQLVKTLLFLEEIQIKDQAEKVAFFNGLSPVLDSFPQEISKHRVLPQLLHAFEFGNAGSAVLAPMFKLGKLLDTEEYQKKIVPCVVKLFTSPDRATRVKLLQQIEYFVEHLQPATVNDQLFPHIVHGFSDTNPVVREQTIKSMLHLAPKLNYKNLHDDLLKHLARLQTKDDQGGIRTNTTVCLGKIASYINPQMRQKVLTSAYLRAIKDPFPPARHASILAMAATHMYFTLQESAMRILPSLCSLTLDPDKGVRDQAFKAIKCFLGKLEKCSENPELVADMEKDVNSGSGAGISGAASWTGWAVSGALGGVSSLTSKIYKGKASQGNVPTAAAAASTNKPAVAAKSNETSPTSPTTSTPAPPPNKRLEEDETVPEKDETGGWEDNWGNEDDWGNMEDMTEQTDTGAAVETGDGDGWDDADWGSLEEPTAPSNSQKHTGQGWDSSDFSPIDDMGGGVTSSSSYNWGDDQDRSKDFFSAQMSDKKKKSTNRTSSSLSTSNKPTSRPSSARSTSSSTNKPSSRASSLEPSGGDGWDESGWDDDTWGDQGLSKAEIARQKREERKAQRQKELEEKKTARAAGKGAMKLGAKKLAKD